VFEFAKAQGWTTILGQIDAGPHGERIVAALHQECPDMHLEREMAPQEYWKNWRDECMLADHIVVNSSWTADALAAEGVPRNKLQRLPVAFEAPPAAATFSRTYPKAFTRLRPLRVLFVGQVSVGKGAAVVLEAMAQLKGAPVEFWFVGPRRLRLPPGAKTDRQARWIGSVARSQVDGYYRSADVFLFPTFSDGFGLTQLEAQAWKLPVIASRHCGEVVRHRDNGILLDTVSADSVVRAIEGILATPASLQVMSDNADTSGYGVRRIGERLLSLAKA
jgi:glycosyltransferase involved in cell wall biosynthesis